MTSSSRYVDFYTTYSHKFILWKTGLLLQQTNYNINKPSA